MELSEKTVQLQILFEKIEKQTQSLSACSGLHCLKGCGACCENPNVETTPLEMIPLAQELWKSGKAEEVWDELDAPSCVLYEADPTIPGNGKCGVYPFRPLICRIFGYAARRNKEGALELATCKKIKEDQPQEIKNAQVAIENGLEVPILSEAWLTLLDIDPDQATKRYPINKALKLALEKVGLAHSLEVEV